MYRGVARIGFARASLCQKFSRLFEYWRLKKRAKNWGKLTQKLACYVTFGRFMGMYWQDFLYPSIWYPLQVSVTHGYNIIRWKSLINSYPFSALFSLPGQLPNATTTPWKWFLRVPWWNTFQWDPREPPKPFLGKKISGLKFLTPYPSPLCTEE